MKKLFLILLLSSACAPITQMNPANPLQTEGRFLQFVSPVNKDIIMQFTFPNKDTCLITLEAIKYQKDAKTTSKYFSCSDSSVSKNLPYRITIRDNTLNYVMDVETFSLQFCKDAVELIPEFEIVSPCQIKNP